MWTHGSTTAGPSAELPLPPGPPWQPPRTPGRVPEPAWAQVDSRRWSDVLAERLHARRMVTVTGSLDTEQAQRAAAELMLLDAEGDGQVTLFVSCPDGELDASLMLTETVELMTAPVTAMARGAVGGAAVAVLAAAEHRLAQPHAVFMLREPRTSAEGRADEVAEAARVLERQLDHLREVLCRAMGATLDEVADDLRRGVVLTADDAVRRGLVHAVASRPSDGLGR